MPMWKEVVSKCLSGRFILTVICGVVFAYISCKRLIPAEAQVAIIVSVFRDYFGRTDRPKEEGKP